MPLCSLLLLLADLEYAPLANLDARLIAAFISTGGTLPARLEGGAVHLSSASWSRWLTPSICSCGPLCIILLLVGVLAFSQAFTRSLV